MSTSYPPFPASPSCRTPWPKPPASRYPEELHAVVTYCLNTDPQQRPSAQQLLQRVRELRKRRLADPTGGSGGSGAVGAAVGPPRR